MQAIQNDETGLIAVIWRFWEIPRSQYHFRGEPTVIDLGDVDAVRTDDIQREIEETLVHA